MKETLSAGNEVGKMQPANPEADMFMSAHSLSQATLQAQGSPQDWTARLASLPPWAWAVIGFSFIFLVLLVIRLRDLPSYFRAKDKSTLDPTQLEELMIGTPPQIVDLRAKEEYEGAKGHIRGALNIPYSEFRKRIDELDTSHPRPIVIVDETDKLSHEVMPLLEKQGHRWLYVLKGGFRAWRASKYPVYFTPQPPKK
jgi:rhodanese-related sulfurtransferase